MKTITMYEARTGKRFERLSEAMRHELEYDVKQIVGKHFGPLFGEDFSRYKIAEYFLIYLLHNGNPWKLAKDLRTLRSRVRDIRKLKEIEPEDEIPF